MKYKLSINNLNETLFIGKSLGSLLTSKIIIGIDGELGCGKTHLTKGIALGLNIKDNITSPTFSLINEYSNDYIELYHFDVHRLNSLDELFLIGFDDYIKKDAIIIIEWSSLIKNILPDDTNYINIYKPNLNDDNKRIIEFNFSTNYDNILKQAVNIFNREINNESFNT